MELIVGSELSELAVPGRELDVLGRTSCGAKGIATLAAFKANDVFLLYTVQVCKGM